MNRYKIQALNELTDQQVRFAPPGRRLQDLRRAEALLTEIDTQRTYPYQWVCFKITEFRPDAYPDLMLAGQDVVHDLGLMIADLAASMPAVPAESIAEPVVTLEDLSKQLNVTTKTIQRWRKRGLIGLPVLVNGRRHVGFLPSFLDPFLAANRSRVERSGSFSLLSKEEKEEILRRARRYVDHGIRSLNAVCRRIARKLDRSPEAIRYTIKNFDRAHPDRALFPRLTGPLDPGKKLEIWNGYRRGMSVETLAKTFCRTRSSMYRILHELRAQKLMDQPIEFIASPEFEDPAREAAILADMPDQEAFDAKRSAMRIPRDAPPELACLYEMPLLTKDQEQHLFRKMNYLKFRAAKTLEDLRLPSGKIDTHKLRMLDLDQVEADLKAANDVKDILISCNMRLVVSIAKRHSGQAENFFELLSDGNMSLIRAVEKFDYSRGNKFSTYGSWAIMKNFARSIPEEKNRRERYQTGKEELFDAAPDVRSDEFECLASAEQASFKVNRLLQYLEPREREIIRLRAGLDDGAEGLTLEKIGERLGITKERVRQLNVRAMKKLRHLAEGEKDDI